MPRRCSLFQPHSIQICVLQASFACGIFEFCHDKELVISNRQTLSNVETLSAEDLEAEVATKLDLARAYVDMGDYDGAREILNEVVDEGSEIQCDEARQMLGRL